MKDAEKNSELSETSKMEVFVEIATRFYKLFFFFAKSYILDVQLGSEFASGIFSFL